MPLGRPNRQPAGSGLWGDEQGSCPSVTYPDAL